MTKSFFQSHLTRKQCQVYLRLDGCQNFYRETLANDERVVKLPTKYHAAPSAILLPSNFRRYEFFPDALPLLGAFVLVTPNVSPRTPRMTLITIVHHIAHHKEFYL